MRRRHFESLRPVCPVCRSLAGGSFPLELACVVREENGHILEGALQCSNGSCLREYPIIDGVPLLVSNLRDYVSQNILSLFGRGDLSPFIESILGDCCGPNSAFDLSRQHLSSYASNHYADFALPRPAGDAGEGSLLHLLREALELSGPAPKGPVLDLGCSVGRSTFELAGQENRLVLGVDLHFPMLRLASQVLRTGTVSYPRRRGGVVYDRQEFPVRFPQAGDVDFWVCDAAALPFAPGIFSRVAALNLLDCVADPHALLESISLVLKQGGKLILTCPYDWSPGATPMEAWLGGHSQRSAIQGSPETVLRALLQPSDHPAAVKGLKLAADRARLPWHVRLHDRSTMRYEVHLVAAEKTE